LEDASGIQRTFLKTKDFGSADQAVEVVADSGEDGVGSIALTVPDPCGAR
jgi:hypothetical protein